MRLESLRFPTVTGVRFYGRLMRDALLAAAFLPHILRGAKRCHNSMWKARRERDAAQAELLEARTILSDAVGHNDEPHETLADCARLLMLDCDAEHERAAAAERERDEVSAALAVRNGDIETWMRDAFARQEERDEARVEAERLRAELAEQTTLAHTMEAELRTERIMRANDANRHRGEVARIRAAAAQRVDLARCEGCPWETRP